MAAGPAVIDLKLAGNREAELYRKLLIAQCNALHDSMPFLFERIDDETELLLPDNLLQTDSIIRKLVAGIDEEDWQEVEILGWIYQFYISEKKELVIGKVVASEDIPAATQLFTPNWIVKYLVQNTLGRQWLATYPQSALRQQMEYYIEPAEQLPEIQEQLRAITPTSLNPEELTLLDPACGSGHILVEAFDVFKAIYQERGYRARDIPRLILRKNLFGLEIDDRACQLATFALMMKARKDDRRIFEHHVQPNVRSLIETAGMDAEDIAAALNVSDTKEEAPPGQLFETEDNLFTRAASTQTRKAYISLTDVQEIVSLFEHAKTFGSLIKVPSVLAAHLPLIEQRCQEVAAQTHEIATSGTAAKFLRVIEQDKMLAHRYDCVVTNPPYMGTKGMNLLLKKSIASTFPIAKTDLFAAFMVRLSSLVRPPGYLGLMTPFTWMFIKSYEGLRRWLLAELSLSSLIRPEYHAFFESAFVPICAFVAQAAKVPKVATFIDLSDFYGEDLQSIKSLEAIHNPQCDWRFHVSVVEFTKIPGAPLAYKLKSRLLAAFGDSPLLSKLADVKEGLNTGDNDRFFRHWAEIDFFAVGFDYTSPQEAKESGRRWFPCVKGGPFRKWYGNVEYVIDWKNDGEEIRNLRDNSGQLLSRVGNVQYFFREGLTWSGVGSSGFSVRHFDCGYVFNSVGRSLFPLQRRYFILGYLNSTVCSAYLKVLAPTLHFSVGDVASLPVAPAHVSTIQEIENLVRRLVEIAREDWNSNEFSWGFRRSSLTARASAHFGHTWQSRWTCAVSDLYVYHSLCFPLRR